MTEVPGPRSESILPPEQRESLREKIDRYFGGPAHVHTTRSSRWGYVEGEFSLDEQLTYLRDILYKDDPQVQDRYLSIAEHTSNPGNPERLAQDDPIIVDIIAEQAEVGQKSKGVNFGLFFGVEANILPDGVVDVPDETLEKLDLVVASRHALPREIEKEPQAIYKTLTEPMKNPHVDVIGHPTRFVDDIGGVNWPAIFAKAHDTNTAIEINLNVFPFLQKESDHQWFDRATLFWERWLKELAGSGAPIFLGIDFHNFRQLRGHPAEKGELSETPGTTAWRKVAHLIEALEEAGIKPERIVNTNTTRLRQWLATDQRAPRKARAR